MSSKVGCVSSGSLLLCTLAITVLCTNILRAWLPRAMQFLFVFNVATTLSTAMETKMMMKSNTVPQREEQESEISESKTRLRHF